MDKHISNMTVTDEEGTKPNHLWLDKQRSQVTASSFGKAVKTKVKILVNFLHKR